MDPRIGQLIDGTFYAYTPEYRDEPFMGSLYDVEAVLGIPHSVSPAIQQEEDAAIQQKMFTVVLCFQHPAWDEVDGIKYADTQAVTKSDANDQARRLAEQDGHLCGGKGRTTFTATEQ